MLLQVWSADPLHLYSLHSLNARFLGATQHPQNQNIWEWGPDALCALKCLRSRGVTHIHLSIKWMNEERGRER